MSGAVRLSYGEMSDNCSRLESIASEFNSVTGNMVSVVNSFSGAWEGQAAATFEEDYAVLQKSLNETTEVLQEITQLVRSYVAQMQEIENSFGKSHVTMN